MINKKLIIFLLFTGSACSKTIAQSNGNGDAGTSILKVIPSSPNAASLGLYGSTPISYYTGTPNVSIPLFEAGAGNLKIPVSLSHHGGGIKVEEMASWVGLGWSLNAGGCITRTVRGIPDDEFKGFFTSPMKIQFMIDNRENPAYKAQIKENLIEAGKGFYDTEADIFYFNFGSYSGKFFYDQEQNEFYTIPRMNMKISYASGNFTFVTEEGNTYTFSTKETTICSNNITHTNSMAITGWYLSKIENANLTNTITFDYEDNYYVFQTSNSSTGYILTSYSGTIGSLEQIPLMQEQYSYQLNQIQGKKLTRINFKNGYIKFTAIGERCDLPGDEYLSSVALYDNANVLKKKYQFEYGYFGDVDQPYNCNDVNAINSRRLKLKKITALNDNNGNTVSQKPYEFDYIDNFMFPGRLSFAQDHWGYYNAVTTNTSLIPKIFYFAPAGPIWWPGANRNVADGANQIGSLAKVIYPTGGSTEFIYESNEVNDPTLDPVTVLNEYNVEGDHNGGIQNYYESAPFVINEPPGLLNGNHPNGGAFVTVKFAEIGNCGYNIPNQPTTPTTCAVLQVIGISGGAVSVGPLSSDLKDYYLPNGTYKLTASFQQSPTTNYEDFFMWITWHSIHPDFINRQYAGGLRIKTIKDYDGIDHTKDIVKNFSYNSANNISSGKINGKAPNYKSEYTQKIFSSHDAGGFCLSDILLRTFIKRNCYSNYPLLTSSGSYVGYENITISYNDTNANGITKYVFKNEPLDVTSHFPHPSESYDYRRGLLLEESQYRKSNDSLDHIFKQSNNYVESAQTLPSTAFKTINGLKVGFNSEVLIFDGPCTPLVAYQEAEAASVPLAEEYQTTTDYIRNISTEKIEYDQSGSNRQLISNQVFGLNEFVYKHASVKTIKSEGDEVITKIRYAKDYATYASAGHFITNLLNKGLVSAPVESYTILKKPNGDQFVVSGSLITYKNTQPLQDKIYRLELTAPLPLAQFTESHNTAGGVFIYDSHYKEEILFSQYDAAYNILEQQRKNDVVNSYIWDYAASFAVAECVNAAAADIAATSFESDGKGNFNFSGTIVTDTTAPTGNKCYSLNYDNIIRSGLTNNIYILSYWSKNGPYSVNNTLPARTGKTLAGWTYYEHEFTASSVTVTGNGYIDELRLYPKGAQMKTYTCDPLVGVTTQCDAANNIIYYEYEPLGRLMLIRDENRNILKQYYYD